MNASQGHQQTELLSPAGDETCLRAAVENGADAVYFGLNHGFNARARAANFELESLPRIAEYLHLRGVRGYVTLNTLAFSDELKELERTVIRVAEAGLDAVLVQDLGLARLIRTICPELEIHASTQMTLSSAECLAVARELGIARVVLPRELSLDEIRQIHQRSDIPLEAFVHGALCVAYSGQCLTSESLGGRSANRGQCAQACRLPYELICDGADIDLGEQKYLLSPQDLAAYHLLPDLLAAGVTSFKIEGRLKTPEYVANITQHYRRALDAALADRPLDFTPDDVREMELSFSRGFSAGWLNGCDHKALVPALSSAKRGVLLGTVRGWQSNRIEIESQMPVALGDGVVFAGNREAGEEQGGRIYAVYNRGRIVQLEFADGAIDVERLHVGQEIWKTDDPKLTAKWRRTFAGPDPVRKVFVDLSVFAVAGQPLRISATTATKVSAEVVSADPLAVARTRPANVEFFREQLSRLGHTVYEMRELHAEIVGEPMIPLSVLSELRRRLIVDLDRKSALPSQRAIAATALERLQADASEVREILLAEHTRKPEALARDTGPSSLASASGFLSSGHRPCAEFYLHVLCRNLAQLQAAVELDVGEFYADFADIREYRQAVEVCRAAGKKLFLAPPRIQKPVEAGIFYSLARHEPDGLLVRNLAGLRFCRERGIAAVADYSLNVTNELTADWLMRQPAQRLTASYDLNRDQLLELIAATPPAWFEVVIHQHMPLFHMEHCVFCAVLSPGTNKTNCGRPCDTHIVQLRDRVGMEHPLTADVGCRNTLFNARAQSAAEVVPDLLTRGVRDFRIELLDESPRDLQRMVRLYQELLSGRKAGADVWRELHASNRVGVTRGTLEEHRNPLAIL